MIGDIIRKERLNRKIKAIDFAKSVDINCGFLTHIEKNERKPSRAVLARICKELNLSYDFMLPMLEIPLDETSAEYDVSKYTPAKKVLFIENLSLVEYPALSEPISFLTKMTDSSMEPSIKKDSTLAIKHTSVINNGEICIVSFNGEILIRRFFSTPHGIELKADNKSFANIVVNPDIDSLDIIGKIINN